MSAVDAPRRTSRARGVAWPVVLAASGLLLIVGIVDLGGDSFWADEADTWYVTSQDFPHLVDTIAAWDVHAAAYYLLIWLLSPLGESEWWLRLPSVLFAVAAVPVVAVLATRWFGRWVGAAAALVLASHGFLVAYAQQARSYTMAVLLVAVSGLLLDLARERRSRATWVSWAAVTGLLFVTHLFGAMVAMVALIGALWRDRSLVRCARLWWSVAVVTAFGGVVTVVVFAQHGETSFDFVGGVLEPATYFDLFRDLSGGGRLTLVVVAVPTVALIVDTWRRVSVGDRGDPLAAQVQTIVAVMAPVLLTFVMSVLASESLLLSRYLMVVLPYVAIAVARGAQVLPGPWLRYVIVGAFLAASCLRWMAVYEARGLQDFRSLTADWLEQAEPGDAVAFFTTYHRIGVAYYVREEPPDRLPIPVQPDDPWPVGWDGSSELNADEVLASLDEGQTLWLVVNVGERELVDRDPRWNVAEAVARIESALGPPRVVEYDGLALYRFDR